MVELGCELGLLAIQDLPQLLPDSFLWRSLGRQGLGFSCKGWNILSQVAFPFQLLALLSYPDARTHAQEDTWHCVGKQVVPRRG